MGTRERKEREKTKRVNDILESARRVFEKKGFLKTTLQDVAHDAEISVGLIYRYFQSKEDIFASIALKGAEEFDKKVENILRKAITPRKKKDPETTLHDLAKIFIEFYEPYGEYFDLLMYSYKGLKQIQIHSTTLTRLMRVTLTTVDRMKQFVQTHPGFRASDEESALSVVFTLWSTLLGCHKLFDRSGRGHLFAFVEEDFLKKMIGHLLTGIGKINHESNPLDFTSRASHANETRTLKKN